MSDERRHGVGLSRRQLERELQWMMRRPPTDPAALAKLMGQVVISLIDKNNAALARFVESNGDGQPGAP